MVEWAGVGRERLGWDQGPSRHSFPLPFLLTDKLWFCCLSPNHKMLQYGDVEEGASPPTLESLPEQRKDDGSGVRVSHLPSRDHPLSGDHWSAWPSPRSPCGRYQGTAHRQRLPPRPGEGLREAEQGECSGGQGLLPTCTCPALFPAQHSPLPASPRISMS